MRAFLTGAIIGLTGYTLGVIAARALTRHHDQPATQTDEVMVCHPDCPICNGPFDGMDDWDNEATPADYTPSPSPPNPHPPFTPHDQ
jgi:hypothetical protein